MKCQIESSKDLKEVVLGPLEISLRGKRQMTTQEKQNDLDYTFIEKLKTKNEKQLIIMLDVLEKEITKIKAEKTKLENKLNDILNKETLIKEAICKKWNFISIEKLINYLMKN